MNDNFDDGHERKQAAVDNNTPAMLRIWRTVPPNRMSTAERALIADCVSGVSATSNDWRRALGGDAASAIYLALRMDTPAKLTWRVDLVMTVLSHVAFEDETAALVMAHRLNAMPIEPELRAELATSWLLYGVQLGSRRNAGASRRRTNRKRGA